MPLEDVESPPYPGDGSNADVLFNAFKALRKWVMHYRDDMNMMTCQEIVPNVIELPDKKAYTSQPVCTQFNHLLFMRRIREEWDHLVRIYEEDWNCKACNRAKVMLVQTAAMLINGAFTPFEVREARNQQDLEHMQRSFERLAAFLRKVMNPEDYDREKSEQ